jgi:undecaprenyl-diphosphatase
LETLYLQAGFLGLIEAATEFLPVSSTGHLLLTGHFLGFESPAGKVFEVVIQLGAILAICVLYWKRLWQVLVGLPIQRKSRTFTLNVLLAFLPAAVVGLLAYHYIKDVLFNPWVVGATLVLGGLAMLAVEKYAPQPRTRSVEAMTWRTALGIGLIQCLSMIPGVSRAGATIMGALALGVERKIATEFSFFLAIPTMFAATLYDLYKSRDLLNGDDLSLIAVGFVVSFLGALAVVKWFIGYVAKHTFNAFAWYRIVLGAAALAALSLGF